MADDVKTISKDDLKGKIDRDEPVQIVNVLSPEGWSQGLIKGSKKIPLSELGSRLGELDKSREVVTYCASRQCAASRSAAETLARKGYDVKAYEGGIQEWKMAGLPTE